MFVPAKFVRLWMSNYFDKFGRLHHKPCVDGEPSSNNGYIYSAYYHKLGKPLNFTVMYECFKDCVKQRTDGQLYTIRSPDKLLPPQSRDEILGLASLGLLKQIHLDGWNFSPYPIPPFSLRTLIKQVLELKGQHRNYFWKNGLSQIYRFAFSTPMQDRAFILECWGETRSLRYFFYKAIAFLDSKIGKPKNGIPWLKYGGEERKKIMQTEFPEDHPLRIL
jgi:hypothetical protein